MADLTDLAVIREVLTRHGFSFSKALGQNFLVNPAVCPEMADRCGADKETGVLEIGPGLGVLTKELALRAKKVVSVELDKRLLPVLDETMQAFDNVTVVNADILEADLSALFAEHFAGLRVVVCANLPYYITSPVLLRLLESDLPRGSWLENACVKPGSQERVEIAVRMPGKDAENPVLLPIDSKFPAEDHQRLISAREKGAADEIKNPKRRLRPRFPNRQSAYRLNT